MVTKLDRLARSVAHLLKITRKRGERRRAQGSELDLGTGSATGRLMLTVRGGIAEFARGIMLGWQSEGIAKTKAAGKYQGRKPTACTKSDQARQLKERGVRPTDIAKRLGVGRASVYPTPQEA